MRMIERVKKEMATPTRVPFQDGFFEEHRPGTWTIKAKEFIVRKEIESVDLHATDVNDLEKFFYEFYDPKRVCHWSQVKNVKEIMERTPASGGYYLPTPGIVFFYESY